jgi:putative chitinase
MGVRQSGPLGLYLHFEQPPLFGLLSGAVLTRRLVLAAPLGTPAAVTATKTAKMKHAAKKNATAPKAAPVAALNLAKTERDFVELQPLPGGLSASLLKAAMRISDKRAETWVAGLNEACRKYEIDKSIRRMAAFLGHIGLETGGLHRVEENLYYKDAADVAKKFSAFKNEAEAAKFLRAPEKFANKAYAHKNGNGDEASGEGWRYRGRGLIQVTGKGNYRACGKALGIDAVKSPELLATPQYAALSAGWFWQSHGLNELADSEQYKALSLRINKHLKSFPEREAKRAVALNALCRAQVGSMAFVMAHFP